MTTAYHSPVLLHKSIDGLKIDPEGIYADVTFGGGGHSGEIMKHLRNGRLIALDQDPDAEVNAIPDPRFRLITANFSRLKEVLEGLGITSLNGILADLGVSSHQFDTPERGFSTRFDSELDMRMSEEAKRTAADVLNTCTEDELKNIFRNYGEVENAGKLAKTICSARKTGPVRTSGELKRIIEKCVRKDRENQYLARVFQALRIEVNDELQALKALLEQSAGILAKGGRLVVISYHSLEDRMVKNFMKTGNTEGKLEKDFYGRPKRPFHMITKKPLVPEEEEILQNKRARSAKLRIAEKIQENG